MTYPNGPYGGGFAGQQPGFPQQSGYPQSGYPGGQQPYGLPPTSPSGVTGIIAGVLAAVGGVVNVLIGGLAADTYPQAARLAATFPNVGVSVTPLIFIAVLYIVVGGLLASGAVLLFLRKSIGRWLVVAGCAAYIAGGVVVATAVRLHGFPNSWVAGANPLSFLGFVFPVATLVLALVPSTAAWIRAKPQSGPPPTAYPAYPYYPG